MVHPAPTITPAQVCYFEKRSYFVGNSFYSIESHSWSCLSKSATSSLLLIADRKVFHDSAIESGSLGSSAAFDSEARVPGFRPFDPWELIPFVRLEAPHEAPCCCCCVASSQERLLEKFCSQCSFLCDLFRNFVILYSSCLIDYHPLQIQQNCRPSKRRYFPSKRRCPPRRPALYCPRSCRRHKKAQLQMRLCFETKPVRFKVMLFAVRFEVIC